MYRNLLLFIFSLAFSATSMAQTMTAEQVSQDSTLNIIAYFCKNDTLEYIHHDFVAKVVDNDTVVDHHFISKFQLIVRDSTADGYVIESIPLETEMSFGKDTLMTKFMQAIVDKMGDISTIFTTDEFGAIQHIKNWKEIREFMRKALKVGFDSLYANYPAMKEAIPRARFESLTMQKFLSEKAILENCDDLQLLFSLHGKSLTIGKTETDETDENGFPSHIDLVCGYGKTDEEDGFDDDFFVECVSKTTIPKEDVKDYTLTFFNSLIADSLSATVNENVGNVDFQDANITMYENYEYFYNGWPCDMEKSKTTELMDHKRIEINRIYWTSRVWGVFGGDNNDNGSAKL